MVGLDVSHDCWHGAYSAFKRFRVALAKAAEIPLNLMDGYYHQKSHEYMWAKAEYDRRRGTNFVPPDGLVNYFEVVDEWLPIPWKKFNNDYLCILLNHSDRDGEIEHKYCLPLANRINEILPSLENLPDGGGHLGDIALAARRFICGLLMAHAAGDDVEFG